MQTKTCFKCGETKPLDAFHKHARMADGHLNKCGACVVKCVAEWRLKNPLDRKAEYAKVRERSGTKTRSEWLADLKANSAGRKATALKWSRANKEKTAAYLKAARAADPEKFRARSAAAKKAMREARDPKFLAANCACQSRRLAAQRKRTPSWADHFLIDGMYELAAVFRSTGLLMEVDHIVPLQGKAVSGLHVHDNLQLLVKSANAAKRNKF